MLTPLDKMLAQAEVGNYAVIAPDFLNLMTVTALIELAEELEAPLLLSYAPVFKSSRDAGSYRQFIELIRSVGDNASVPVGLHLDHATTLDEIQEAVNLGYTSVMIDASRESWAVNVSRTKEAVAIAHAAGVPVEAELGHVAVGSKYIAQADQNDNETAFTDPDQAAEFVELTGIDALAVSVGTIHGDYRGEPMIQFDRLQQIRDKVPVPLVLHGSSGTGDSNLQRAIGLGIRKINVFTALVTAVREELAATIQTGNMGPIEMADAQRRAVYRAIKPYLQVSGSVGTAVSKPVDIPRYAEALFRDGYGCTEAVFRAFSATEGYASDTTQRATSLFSGGMCHQGLTCGALVGGLMVIGARNAPANPAYKQPREQARALGVELIQWYQQQKGSSVCRNLLDLDLSDPEQAKQYKTDLHFDHICTPLVVETCQWLLDRFAEETS